MAIYRVRFGKAAAFMFACGVVATACFARGELVGHWTLDNDTTGLMNLGTDGATSDLTVMGTVLPAFNPTGGYDGGGYATFVSAPSPTALVAVAEGNAAADIAAAGGYPFSFSAWFRSPIPVPTGLPRGTVMALSTPAASGDFMQMSVGYNDAGQDFETNRRFGGATNLIDAVGSGPVINDGNWHHLAGVYPDASTVLLYVDGILQTLSDVPPTVNFPTTISAINIGAFRRNTSQVQDVMRGDIDDARLYNHALTLAEVRTLAGLVPGDFDGDGDVDGADFVAWQTNFPLDSGATLGQGDADGDGDVDGADFVVWQTNFPFTPSPSTAPVPEPTSLVLAIVGVLGMAAAYGRRSKRIVG